MSHTPTPAPTRTRSTLAPTAFRNAAIYSYGVPAFPRRVQPLAAVKTGYPLSQVSHHFSPGTHRYQHVVPTEFSELLAKIDREHAPGERFFVVSRQTKSKNGAYQTTVMHENTRIFYRAFHLTGISTMLKGVERRRAPYVTVLRSGGSYHRPVGRRAAAGEGAAE